MSKKPFALWLAAGLLAASAYAAPTWQEGSTYTAGTQVDYNGSTYQALVTHTAYVGANWNPAGTPTLWKVVGTASPTPTPTTKPTTAPTATPVPTSKPTATPVPTTKPTSTPVPTATPVPTSKPTVAPTSTPVPTTAPTATPKPTSTPVPTATPVPTTAPTTAPTATPTGTPSGTPCATAWSAGAIYNGGNSASYQGHNYTAKWWTQGNDPSQGGVWVDAGSCSNGGTGGIGGTPVPTTTPVPSGPPTLQQALAREAELTNNDFFRSIKATIRTLPNADVEKVAAGNTANPINVKRVERLLPEAKWNYYFEIRDTSYSYQRFLQAVAKFPAVCDDYKDGRDADAICRHSLATMFAHFAQETGDHNANIATPQWRQGLKYLREMGCDETGAGCGYNTECADPVFNKVWTCGKNADGSWKKYFGRGAKQLSYNYNYGPFSQAMNNGDQFVLLNNPDLVASTWLNLASATFFFVYPQPPKPSMLQVIDGTWVPNQVDVANGAGNNFATTIQIINAECGLGTEKQAAQNRIDYYKQFAADLGWDYSKEQLSCATMKRFDAGSSAAYNIYWEKNWNVGGDNQCQLVSYQTPYNALMEGNYVKCVQDNWGITLK
ncbi:Carbohydrate binding domain-containing protein [Andreprevotia lacus DSM 23236]|uniref:Carbohydrate binding domain-containing protein n=1 Tax=Andreprevotia lacus DSM 23236 TaxID=1121001 RepID=A0A1W1X982_9NEIS|nr:glycoside hydrolase family 19 protein [Andreprevotia lacus]SMC20449.1 Carbohydrate binding domain-containing protein [Andreprevotia lacus DSM 23236]